MISTLGLVAVSALAHARVRAHPELKSPHEPRVVGELDAIPEAWRYTLLGANGRPDPEPHEFRVVVDQITVVRACNFDGCQIGLVSETDGPFSFVDVPEDAPFQNLAENMEMLRAPGEHIIYLRCSGHWGRLDAGRTCNRADHPLAFELVDGRWRPTPDRLGGMFERRAYPTDFVFAGFLGVALSLLGWVARFRAARRRRAMLGATPGVLGPDGWVTMQDGTVLRVDGSLLFPAGPVLVQGDNAGGSYRDGAKVAAKDVIAGTHADWAEAALRDVERWEASILTITCLAIAPLIAIVITLR
ncbi:MAG: hypothetical protein ABI193_24935 [Minicystis sp.]